MIADLNSYQCFVSMPFNSRFDGVYGEGLFRASEHVEDCEINFVRLDKQTYEQRRIEENVLENINKSDFLIADISKYPDSPHANVSVMHEIGYACGKNIPFLLIGEKGTHKRMPSNLSGLIITEYDPENDSEFTDFSKRFGEVLKRLISQDISKRVRGRFQAEVFSDREKIGISRLIEKASRRVYILTTNLDYTSTHLVDSLEIALKNNVSNTAFGIEILTIDPESEVTNQRAKQLGTPVRDYRDIMRASLKSMDDRFENNSKVKIYTYKEFPTQKTFIVDNTIITSISALGQLSREGVHYVMHQNPDATDTFLSHFRTLKMLAVSPR